MKFNFSLNFPFTNNKWVKCESSPMLELLIRWGLEGVSLSACNKHRVDSRLYNQRLGEHSWTLTLRRPEIPFTMNQSVWYYELNVTDELSVWEGKNIRLCFFECVSVIRVRVCVCVCVSPVLQSVMIDSLRFTGGWKYKDPDLRL